MSIPRTYTSAVRDEQALATRLRIRKAAAELFASQGFSSTTIAAIAHHADVATPTIYAVFGSKAGIVAAMLEELDENADSEVWERDIIGATDASEQVRQFAAWITALYGGGVHILRAVLEAKSNPDVLALYDRGEAGRRQGTTLLVTMWKERGALKARMKPERAAEELFLLTSVEQYLSAVDGLDWTNARYQEWLERVVANEFLES